MNVFSIGRLWLSRNIHHLLFEWFILLFMISPSLSDRTFFSLFVISLMFFLLSISLTFLVSFFFFGSIFFVFLKSHCSYFGGITFAFLHSTPPYCLQNTFFFIVTMSKITVVVHKDSLWLQNSFLVYVFQIIPIIVKQFCWWLLIDFKETIYYTLLYIRYFLENKHVFAVTKKCHSCNSYCFYIPVAVIVSTFL